ncbi:MAG: sigma-54-dependent Fis family transcriptional regulator, partial [Gemmatimonadetes bacterium]|nr:sigma-54-dependent Fis family transcriptional regulator [Gemmatimonadota bacterium]
MARILIADDNRTTTTALATLVERWGHTALTAFDGRQAVEVMEDKVVDVLVTDLKMPELDGMQVLEQVQQRWPETIVIVVTAFGTIESAVDAMRLGAFDYLTKPYDHDELRAKVERAVEQQRLLQQLERMNARLAEFEKDTGGFDEIVGTSDVMKQVYEQIDKVAETDSTVLILGESGTGKELVARAIHRHSLRAETGFVAVHCAAYAENLLESELFGHEKGAFTGATARKIGRLELADGGTLLLDEIGEVSAAVQVKLLRVLQEREFERVGSTQTIGFDSRIIAATNRDLEQAINSGEFRQDLFYRLNVFTLQLPSLRERRQDITALVGVFLEQQARKRGRDGFDMRPAALAALTHYDWPGNIRELQNVIERATILASDGVVDVEHLPVGVA